MFGTRGVAAKDAKPNPGRQLLWLPELLSSSDLNQTLHKILAITFVVGGLRGNSVRPGIGATSLEKVCLAVGQGVGVGEPVLKSIIDKIRQESGITAEVPSERLVDLSILREVRAELRRR